jgi:hypothetical protein
MDSPVFDTTMGERALGRDTPATVAHWPAIVASMPVAPRIFGAAPVPRKSPDVRRFHYMAFKDQRSRGFCVGFNSNATVMTRLRIPDGATPTTGEPLPEINLSALYMYDISRMEAAAEGFNLGRGDGGIGSCAAKGSQKNGVCLANLYPDAGQVVDSHVNNSRPDGGATAFGQLHPVKEIALADSWEHGLELNAGGMPLAICSDIPGSMMNCDASGAFRMRGGVVGGHCYQLIDHDQDRNLAWVGQCWARWGEQSADPAYAPRGGFTQIGTCPLDELARWFSPNAMANGSSEIVAFNTVAGFAPPILDLGDW